MPRVSIVVPVYNVERYLDWCLDSLVGQTERDIEIICVNDGSTDGSREILESRRRQDSRIVIVDKPNGGLSSARNAGIDVSTAPFVCFVDSDDRLVLTACETIAKALERTGADVLTFGANCYPPEAGYPWLEDVLSPRDVEYDSFSMDVLFKEKSRPFAWRTACKTDFLRDCNLRFDETLKFGEDQVFHFEVYPRASKIAFISDKLYDYRVAREGSLMDRMKGDPAAKLTEHIAIAEAIFSDWANQGMLSAHMARMVEWVVEFAGFETLELGKGEYAAVAGRMRKFLSKFLTSKDVEKMDAPKAVLDIVKAIVDDPASIGAAKKARLMAAYYIYRYGWKAFVMRALHR